MRTIAWCVLTLSLVGCQSGPRWGMRDYDTRGPASYYEDQPQFDSVPTTPQPAQPALDGLAPPPPLPPPPQPAQRERAPYQSSARPRSLFGGSTTTQASRARATTSSRSTETARRGTTSPLSTKPVSQDDSFKRLLADLEKTKREKAALETKLTEETAKQTQQRLELEARLALIQEQMRQQSALQQVTYQQQAAAMSRPLPSSAGPTITSGAPNPSLQMPFAPSTPGFAPQAQQQAVPAWGNSAPAWNTPSAPPQQQVEQWPYSPQRR